MMILIYFGYGLFVNVDIVLENVEFVLGWFSGWIWEWWVCGMWENG